MDIKATLILLQVVLGQNNHVSFDPMEYVIGLNLTEMIPNLNISQLFSCDKILIGERYYDIETTVWKCFCGSKCSVHLGRIRTYTRTDLLQCFDTNRTIFADITPIEQCIDDRNEKNLMPMIPVYDSYGNVYKSYKYARCNGLSDFRFFDLHILLDSCKIPISSISALLSKTFYKTLDLAFCYRCDIYFSAPSIVIQNVCAEGTVQSTSPAYCKMRQIDYVIQENQANECRARFVTSDECLRAPNKSESTLVYYHTLAGVQQSWSNENCSENLVQGVFCRQAVIYHPILNMSFHLSSYHKITNNLEKFAPIYIFKTLRSNYSINGDIITRRSEGVNENGTLCIVLDVTVPVTPTSRRVTFPKGLKTTQNDLDRQLQLFKRVSEVVYRNRTFSVLTGNPCGDTWRENSSETSVTTQPFTEIQRIMTKMSTFDDGDDYDDTDVYFSVDRFGVPHQLNPQSVNFYDTPKTPNTATSPPNTPNETPNSPTDFPSSFSSKRSLLIPILMSLSCVVLM